MAGIHAFTDTKVSDLGNQVMVIVAGEQDVLRFDIPVNDPLAVQVFESFQYPDKDIGQCMVIGVMVFQVTVDLPFHCQFHDTDLYIFFFAMDIGIGNAFDPVKFHNIGMGKADHPFYFIGDIVFGGGIGGMEEFQRHIDLQDLIVRFIYRCKATFTNDIGFGVVNVFIEEFQGGVGFGGCIRLIHFPWWTEFRQFFRPAA
jgi:hypothetical protein